MRKLCCFFGLPFSINQFEQHHRTTSACLFYQPRIAELYAMFALDLQVKDLKEVVSKLPALTEEVNALEYQNRSLEQLQQRANDLSARNDQLRAEVRGFLSPHAGLAVKLKQQESQSYTNELQVLV
jgi:hypothetical protein